MRHSVAWVLLLLVAPRVVAQQASLTGSGARAMGMGGAWIAVADDATAISWNPAGLTRLDAPELGAAVTFGSGSWELDLSSDFASFIEVSDIEMSSRLSLNFASAVYPFRLGGRHAVAGIAYRRYWDQTVNTVLSFSFRDPMLSDVDGDGYEDGYVDRLSSETDVSGAVGAITPALAIQLSPLLSVGLTASIMVGGRDATEAETTHYTDFWGFQDAYQEESTLSYGYSGFTAEFGLLADLSPRVKAGAVASLPWTLTLKDVEEDGVSLGEDVKQKLPAFFGLGIAIKPQPMTTLAFDVRQHPWSKVEIDSEESGWADATVLRAGVEHIFQTPRGAIVPLRAGFFLEPLPEREVFSDESTDEIRYGDQLKNAGFTLGVGLVLGRIVFDASLARTRLSFESDYGENTRTETSFTLSTVVHLGGERD